MLLVFNGKTFCHPTKPEFTKTWEELVAEPDFPTPSKIFAEIFNRSFERRDLLRVLNKISATKRFSG